MSRIVKCSFKPIRRLLGCLIIAMFAMSIAAPCFAANGENHCNYNDISCQSKKASSTQDGNIDAEDAQEHCCAMHISKSPTSLGFRIAAYSEEVIRLSFNDSVRIKDPLQGLFRPPQA